MKIHRHKTNTFIALLKSKRLLGDKSPGLPPYPNICHQYYYRFDRDKPHGLLRFVLECRFSRTCAHMSQIHINYFIIVYKHINILPIY